jgi:hypothetical protein
VAEGLEEAWVMPGRQIVAEVRVRRDRCELVDGALKRRHVPPAGIVGALRVRAA